MNNRRVTVFRLRKLRYDTIRKMQLHIISLRDAAFRLTELKDDMHRKAAEIYGGEGYEGDGLMLDLEKYGTLEQQREREILDWPAAPGLEDILEVAMDFVETAARMRTAHDPPPLPCEPSFDA